MMKLPTKMYNCFRQRSKVPGEGRLHHVKTLKSNFNDFFPFIRIEKGQVSAAKQMDGASLAETHFS